ncbi:MAG TPA: RNA polymerase sigma factor [Bryobacteraceae bacterium]|jgi:RNA polymerase sigma-70 factor (ECF subfamily)|nr:RNA polymerase sigma factor [Bryobacteraceae bacterium]
MDIASHDTDHDRMAAVARGDLSGMNEIYRNRHRPLFRFFYRLTNRQATAEDLVHEVFLRMIRYRHTYQAQVGQAQETDRDPPHAFEAWMYRIARNAMADHSRKHRNEIAPGEGELESIASARPTPFETAAKRQDLSLLHRALRELPEDRRELLILARFQGLSYERIGQILGCQAGTVKGRVFRAMKELGSIYSDLCREKAS